MKVNFSYVYGRKKKNNKGLIELCCYENPKRLYVSTGVSVLVSEWDSEKKRIVRHPDRDSLNIQLDTLWDKVNKAQTKAHVNEQPFDLEIVRQLLKNDKIKTNSFTDFATNEIENNNAIKEVTKRSQRNTLNKIIAFNEHENILFTEINYTFCSGFINYLKGLNQGQNTIKKHYKNFKTLIETATKKGLYDKSNPLKDIKVKETEVKIVALTWDQVLAIEAIRFEPYEKKLSLFRDMFLFSCYTGLRVSDLMDLKPEHIKQTDDGIYIDKKTIKVSKHAEIPLSKLFPLSNENTTRPLKILNKYLDQNKEFVFKKYTDQVYNLGLKDIAHKAKIYDIKLTSHIGRKTFLTYLANNGNASTFVVKNLAQHSNIKTTERYVFTDKKRVAENLENANWN